jgi:hypothetical protein
MCGGKYDHGRFNEDTGEWEFPRYLLDGQPVQGWMNEAYPLWGRLHRQVLTVHLWSARIWGKKLAFRAALPQIRAAFAEGFVEELEQR